MTTGDKRNRSARSDVGGIRRTSRRRWALLLLAPIGGLVGSLLVLKATPHAPYRVPEGEIETSIAELVRSEEARVAAGRSCLETHVVGGQERFKVGFVEFDDQGLFWSRDQLGTLEREFDEAAASPDHDGVLTVVFVHGWQHNASVCDQNVACFRDMLEALANAEDYRVHALRNARAEAGSQGVASDIRPRYVFGVYVGWRGLSNSLPGLQLTTFFNRKATAHRVGAGEVIELFTRLEVWRDELVAAGQDASKLVILGHSFGGALTYSALSRVLHERLARAAAEGRTGPDAIRGFGDLVVLINPAFEASLYSGIYQLARQIPEFDENQPAVLVTVSSRSDTATNIAFPTGRLFATPFSNTRDGEQSEAMVTTIGNFEGHRTHLLELASEEELRGLARLDDIAEVDAAKARGAADCKCDYFEAAVKAAEDDPFGEFRIYPAHGVYGDTKLIPLDGTDERTPFITALTTDEVVTNHNGIYNRYFLNFLRSFLMEMDRRSHAVSAFEAAGSTEAVQVQGAS